MSNAREVVVVSGVRTAIGDFGGALKDLSPTELGARVTREAISRAGIEAAEIGHVVFGNVIQTEPKDMYLSRVCAMNGGIPQETPAMTLNRLCGSGLQAIVSAAQSIMLGDADIALAGGAESMSRSNYVMPAARWGQRMGDEPLIDWMTGALSDPFDKEHMGVTAERIAERWSLSRELQDEYALESHRRAAAAIAAGHFKSQILPVELKGKKGTVIFDTDEHVRPDVQLGDMTKLRAVFQKDGTVTAGNASGLNDAAAAVVLMERGIAEKKGLKPLARLVSYGHAGVDPKIMGIGPVPAIRKILARQSLTMGDIGVIELNEAFASQALACTRSLGLDDEDHRVNPNGGAIALGHPLGMSGARITGSAAIELAQGTGRYAIVSMCVGVGQGSALLLERV